MPATDQPQSPVTKDPMRHYKHYKQDGKHPSPYAGGSSFMERVAENVASGMGTVQFVVVGSLIILGWVFINGAVKYLEATGKAITKGGEFDPEPWILLNLIFSGVAFSTGALVIIAQKAMLRTCLCPAARGTVQVPAGAMLTAPGRDLPALQTEKIPVLRACWLAIQPPR